MELVITGRRNQDLVRYVEPWQAGCVTVSMAYNKIHVGTAGFSYSDWLGNFYPQFCPAADYLRCYAMTFSTVEIDSTFYRIPSKEAVKRWVDSTPDDFLIAAKFPRTVTHEGDLKSRLAEAEKFVEVIQTAGDKLGPLLLQFPPSFKPDRRPLLESLLGILPPSLRIAVEFRCTEWLEDELYSLLRKRGIGLCLSEYPGMPRLDIRTSDLVYVRFIGDRHAITEDFSWVRSEYSAEMSGWEELVRRFAGENADIFAFFNNHFSGHAPSTALEFKERLDGQPT